MRANKAKQKGFTHRGKMYDIPIYLSEDEEMNVRGTNWFNEAFLRLFIWIDITLNPYNNEGFFILKGEKL